MKKTCLLRTLACLASAAIAGELRAQELIANGDFEGAALTPWVVSAPAGSSIASLNESSPYQTVYPAGTKAARLQDDDSEFETPFFEQAFAPQSAIQFSFDFKAASASAGSPWYVIWRGVLADETTTAFFFSIGGQDGVSIELNQSKIATLEENMWYHIEGTASAPGQSVSGSILNSRGERETFTGGFPFGNLSSVNGVRVTDGDQARNEPLIVDNFSARTATVLPARLSIAPAPDGQVTVSWTTAGYSLQGAAEVGPSAQWSDIQTSGQSYTTDADQPARFFRLIHR